MKQYLYMKFPYLGAKSSCSLFKIELQQFNFSF